MYSAVDVGGEVLRDHGALHLQRRRDVVVVGGEVDRQDDELADRLGPGDRLVRVVDRGLELGEQVRIISQVRRGRVGWLAVLLLPVLERLRVQRDQARDERLVVADDHDLADQRVRPQPVLEHGRGDVLAARGDDELLLAAGDAQEALVVQRAEVAGVQPAVGVERLLGRCLVLPVAAEDDLAAEQDLAVVGDPGGDAGQGLADGADLVAARLVDRRRGRRLGHAVALEHGDARAAEEVAEPLAQRRAARYRVGDLAADGRAQLAVDEAIEQRVAGLQAQAGAARIRWPGCRRWPSRPRRRRSCSWPGSRTPAAARCCRPSRTPGARRAGTSAGTRAGRRPRCRCPPSARGRRLTPGSRSR